MQCETMVPQYEVQHISPMNRAGHWRTRLARYLPCLHQAAFHVHVAYPDQAPVDRNMCQACLDVWRRDVAAIEARSDIPALGIIEPKSVWTITPLVQVAQTQEGQQAVQP